MVSELTEGFLWVACSLTLVSFPGLDCKQSETGIREGLETMLLRPQEMLHDTLFILCDWWLVLICTQSLTLGFRLQISNSPAMVSIRPETFGLFPPPPMVIASATASRYEDKKQEKEAPPQPTFLLPLLLFLLLLFFLSRGCYLLHLCCGAMLSEVDKVGLLVTALTIPLKKSAKNFCNDTCLHCAFIHSSRIHLIQ